MEPRPRSTAKRKPNLTQAGRSPSKHRMKYVSFQSQTIELKPLPEHLKYTYLGDNPQFSVIIANNFNKEQEEKLLEVLRKHKKAIGWTLADLPGINPSICMPKI
ncbi:hypothetical protein CR513_29229, partial [Mucuna pruriens]